MSLTSGDLKAIKELLEPIIEPIREEQKRQGKEIRSMKIKVNKTWNLLSWFAKDADERIVNNTRRIDTLEKIIKPN